MNTPNRRELNDGTGRGSSWRGERGSELIDESVENLDMFRLYCHQYRQSKQTEVSTVLLKLRALISSIIVVVVFGDGSYGT